MFYIIKPNKLTKREQAAQDTLINFDYVLYDKIDLDMYKDNNLFSEYWKTVNMISIVKKIKECIYDNIQGRKSYKLYIVQEGISYGSSVRTKSVFDLAGLNYMIRNEFIEKENISFFIAPPTHIKKFATGIGNCKKELIIELFKSVEPELANNLPKVDVIADALQKVSRHRATLGAVQNRLDHTIKNLDNIVENTTAAEAQIRDTDMAEEMVKYSNTNILQQAGQSMLAQANQSNQGVLSLLQG